MSNTARIIIDLALPDGQQVDQRVLDALDDLAAIMLVQAEDGLYTGGSPEAEDAEFVLDWGVYGNGPGHYSASVELVDIDHASSASSQHFIDTGRYLTKREVFEDHLAECDDCR